MWPEAIVERVYPGGRIVLVEAGERFFDDGFSRSRPVNAARLDRVDGGFELGYVVLIRAADGSTSTPTRERVWELARDDCEIGLKRPASGLEWLPCSEVRRVVWPNVLTLAERLDVAFRRVLVRT